MTPQEEDRSVAAKALQRLDVPAPVEPRTIEDAVETFRKWLHLPDPGVVLIVLGAVAANFHDGDPVWLLLVGPPGSGKTEPLQATAGLAHVHPTSTLTEAALLSGTPKKERAKDAQGGLLREIGDFGILLNKDFCSVLSMHGDSRAQVLAALREVYDGSWTRHVGTEGGKTLSWSGKVGFIAGCTPGIDRQHAVMAAMGERFLIYRLPEVEEEEQAERALAQAGRESEMRAALVEVVTGVFVRGLSEPRPLTADDKQRLVLLATFVVRARSAVERDGYSREIELLTPPEAPTRLIKVLARLLAGMDSIGVERDAAWQVITKAALDSIPALRLLAVKLLHRRGEMDTTAIAEALDCPTQTARRTLEDLAVHKVSRKVDHGKGHAHTWLLADKAAERYSAIEETFPEKSGGTLSASSLSKTTNDISGKVPDTASEGGKPPLSYKPPLDGASNPDEQLGLDGGAP